MDEIWIMEGFWLNEKAKLSTHRRVIRLFRASPSRNCQSDVGPVYSVMLIKLSAVTNLTHTSGLISRWWPSLLSSTNLRPSKWEDQLCCLNSKSELQIESSLDFIKHKTAQFILSQQNRPLTSKKIKCKTTNCFDVMYNVQTVIINVKEIFYENKEK